MRTSWALQDLLAPADSAGTPRDPSPALQGAFPKPFCSSLRVLRSLPFPLTRFPSPRHCLSAVSSRLDCLFCLQPPPPGLARSLLRSRRNGAKSSFSLAGADSVAALGSLSPPPPSVPPLPTPRHCSPVRGVHCTNLRVPSSPSSPRWAADRGGGVPAAHKSGTTFWFGGPWGRGCWARRPGGAQLPGVPRLGS